MISLMCIVELVCRELTSYGVLQFSVFEVMKVSRAHNLLGFYTVVEDSTGRPTQRISSQQSDTFQAPLVTKLLPCHANTDFPLHIAYLIRSIDPQCSKLCRHHNRPLPPRFPFPLALAHLRALQSACMPPHFLGTLFHCAYSLHANMLIAL